MQCFRTALFMCLLLSATLAWSVEGAPTSINDQGKLTALEGGPVTAGNYTFAFKLFNVAAGGTQIWPPAGSENHALVLGTDGLWTALLGKDFALLSDFVDDTARFLDITVTPPVGSPETLSRVRLGSAPFALEAAQLNGRTGDAYVETAGDVMTGRLQIDYGSNGTDIDLRQDGGTAAIVALNSGGALKCQLVGDTKGHLVLFNNPVPGELCHRQGRGARFLGTDVRDRGRHQAQTDFRAL